MELFTANPDLLFWPEVSDKDINTTVSHIVNDIISSNSWKRESIAQTQVFDFFNSLDQEHRTRVFSVIKMTEDEFYGRYFYEKYWKYGQKNYDLLARSLSKIPEKNKFYNLGQFMLWSDAAQQLQNAENDFQASILEAKMLMHLGAVSKIDITLYDIAQVALWAYYEDEKLDDIKAQEHFANIQDTSKVIDLEQMMDKLKSYIPSAYPVPE